MKINCLLIDDEPASQSVILTFVQKIDFLQIIGTCNNAVEALNFLSKTNNIDLLFLDINMPEISGLSFYKSLQKKPLVIFTTAYPQYAIQGFEVNAIDYLLKPFSFDRFFKAVNKVVRKIETKNKSFLHNYILIKSDKKTHKVNFNDIFYIEAYGDYVKIFLEKNTLLTYSKFSILLSKLPENNFIQVHKSYAINLSKITFIEGNKIALKTFNIPIGKMFKNKFLKRLAIT